MSPLRYPSMAGGSSPKSSGGLGKPLNLFSALLLQNYWPTLFARTRIRVGQVATDSPLLLFWLRPWLLFLLQVLLLLVVFLLHLLGLLLVPLFGLLLLRLIRVLLRYTLVLLLLFLSQLLMVLLLLRI